MQQHSCCSLYYFGACLCRLCVWEVHWSCRPSRGLSQSRTVWRMISAAWVMMSPTMDWDTQCTTALCPATSMHFLMVPHAGLGTFLYWLMHYFSDEFCLFCVQCLQSQLWDCCVSEVHMIIFLQHSFKRGIIIVSSAMSLMVNVSVSLKTMLTFTPVLLPPSPGATKAPWMAIWAVQGTCTIGGEGHRWPRVKEGAWLHWTALWGKVPAPAAGVNQSCQRSLPCSTTGWTPSGAMQLLTCSTSPIRMIK